MTTIQLYDNYHSGLTANITFNPTTGGTYSLGSHMIPYTFTSDYIYGDYTLFYPELSQTCTLTITELASTFCFGNGFDSYPYKIVLQPDGKILLGGDFNSYSGVSANYIIRLNSDGTIDNTFNSGVGFDGDVWAIALQSDGKILVGGDFNNYDSNTANYIVRLNSDGTIDNTFNSVGGFDGSVYTIAIQPDGKILCGGGFGVYDGNFAGNIIRLNYNGSINNSFNINTGSGFDYGSGYLNDIKIQTDGKILCAGYFSDYNGTSVGFGLVRLDYYGTLDNTFNTGSGFDSDPNKISIQSDNKIVCAGYFNNYSGFSSNYIIRLNDDGNIDYSFNVGTGLDDAAYGLALQPNGSILVGGAFLNYGGNTSKRIVRLNNDGSIDYSFNTGESFDYDVYDILVQPNGDILVSGDFGYYNYSYYPYFAKIKNDGNLINCPNIVIPTTPFISTWKTTSPNETVDVPFNYGGNCYCTIEWGDGNTDLITYWDQPERYHEYINPGTYTITISGLTTNFSFYGSTSASKIYEIQQFGDIRFYDYGVFQNCTNLVLTGVTDTPNLTNNYSLSSFFYNCTSLTSVNNINSWDISNILDLSNMFYNCTSFNQYINNWNVSGVTSMIEMFKNCTSYNQSLNFWNVSNVVSMYSMFQNCSQFNRPLSTWNVSGVTDMQFMFNNATLFNRNLSGWCVSQIPSAPAFFSTGSALTNPNKPVWGTCPP